MTRRRWMFAVSVCLVVGSFLGGYAAGRRRAAEASPNGGAASVNGAVPSTVTQLSADNPDGVIVPADVVRTLGIHTSRIAANTQSRPLRMPGSLMLDSNRLARIHSRFEGHVMSLGMTDTGDESRPLQFGDAVHKDQVLAVIWSKEIGQKKGELLDAYSQLSLYRSTLDRLKTLKTGEVSEHVLRDAQRNYEGALIAVQSGERTLRSWQLAEADIREIRTEADRLHREGLEEPAAAALREGWAELAVRAPLDGVILEKNVTIGELVDPSLDLFKVADLRRLMVVANAYEEDLSEIESLMPNERRWELRLTAEPDTPPITGDFAVVGKIIDPVQHTAQLVGWIMNPNNSFMAGQFVTAAVSLPPRKDEVTVPTSAIIESGDDGIIFVAVPGAANQFVRRRVIVSHRGRLFAYLRTALTDDERRRGLVAPTLGDWVVSSGVVLLENTWKELSLTTMKDAPHVTSHDTTER